MKFFSNRCSLGHLGFLCLLLCIQSCTSFEEQFNLGSINGLSSGYDSYATNTNASKYGEKPIGKIFQEDTIRYATSSSNDTSNTDQGGIEDPIILSLSDPGKRLINTIPHKDTTRYPVTHSDTSNTDQGGIEDPIILSLSDPGKRLINTIPHKDTIRYPVTHSDTSNTDQGGIEDPIILSKANSLPIKLNKRMLRVRKPD